MGLEDKNNRRILGSAALVLAVGIAVIAATVTLDAYEGRAVPSAGETASLAASGPATERAALEAPASIPAPAPKAAASRPKAGSPLSSEPPRRMQVNHTILRLGVRADAVDFYAHYTGSEEVAQVILDAALRNDVPVNLAFALGWQESRFDTQAVSGRNYYGTRDWGLFQLNDGSRPEWKHEDFFDMARNAEHAMQYLRLCLAEMGSPELALAAYNAGIQGVRDWGIPRSTRAYIRAISAYEKELDRRFGDRF